MLNLVFNLYLLREKGLELCSALQLRGNTEAKELPFISAFLFYLGEEGGYYLRSVAPSSPKPSPTPLHVRGCCTACRLNLTLSHRRFKFAFSRCGSR